MSTTELPDLDLPWGHQDSTAGEPVLDGTPAGPVCPCGAPAVRSSTVTAEDGSSGTLPAGAYVLVPSCDCGADFDLGGL